MSLQDPITLKLKKKMTFLDLQAENVFILDQLVSKLNLGFHLRLRVKILIFKPCLGAFWLFVVVLISSSSSAEWSWSNSIQILINVKINKQAIQTSYF